MNNFSLQLLFMFLTYFNVKIFYGALIFLGRKVVSKTLRVFLINVSLQYTFHLHVNDII